MKRLCAALLLLCGYPALCASAQLTVRWTQANLDNVVNFHVWRSMSGNAVDFVDLAEVPRETRAYLDQTLVQGQRYYYFVKACSTAGCSEPSPTAMGTAGIPETVPTPTTGLAAAYAFDEGSGTRVTDASGNENAGTVTGASWSTGHVGSALTFAGSDKVTVPNSASVDIGGTALTVEFWVNIAAAVSATDFTLLAKPWQAGSMSVPYYQYAVEIDANGSKSVRLFFGNTSGQLRGPFAVTAPFGTWAHIAFTYDGARVTGYVNGTVQLTQAETSPLQPRGTPLQFGVDGAGGQGYKGSLDELRIYRRALSLAEIQADMTAPIAGGGASDATPPTVTITQPTATATYNASSSALTLAGTAADNSGVTHVTWVNNRGGSGTATGTVTWSVPGIDLQAGLNVVTVTARDAATNTATDTLTVTYVVPPAPENFRVDPLTVP